MKKRFLSVTVVVLALILICGIARRDNDRREETMAKWYLNKIWVASDHTGEYYDEFSFCFLEIGDGICRGGLEPDKICHIEECFQIEEGELIWNTNNVFSGTICGNTAECRFTDRWNRSGSIRMVFLNENAIEMTIRYVNRGEAISETRIYRPYNISDMQNYTLQVEQPIRAVLIPEGNAYIAAGAHHWKNGLALLRSEPYSEAYLVNEDRDVLDILSFDASVHVGTKIDDMQMEGMPHMHWLFRQSDMGMFELYSVRVAEEDPILGGYPDAEEGTWEREFQNCVREMELRIKENLRYFDRELKWDTVLWYDTLNRFCQCIEKCAECQSEIMGNEEEVYRTAVFLIAEMRDRRGRSHKPYEFLSSHDGETEMAREEFSVTVKGENPIDDAITMFHEKFDSVYYASYGISELGAKAWEEEFYHCLELVRTLAGQAGAEKEEALLEMLEAYEAFFALWADNEQISQEVEGGSGLRGAIGFSRAEVFRIGTMLLIDGYERAGGSYEFLYDSEADRERLTENFSEFLQTEK